MAKSKKTQNEANEAFKELIKAYDIADELENDGNDISAKKLRRILKKVDTFIVKQM